MIRTTLCFIIIIHVCVAVASVEDEDDEGHYSNSWAVEILGGEDVADRIAETHGFINMGQVGVIPDMYHFMHRNSPPRSRRALDEKHQHLTNENEVKHVEQQVIKKRSKRGHTHYAPPTDPLWNKQWYLHRDNDMNVQPVWEQGITGRGVVVTILDDGLEHDHPDLRNNYDPDASYDFNAHDSDPIPRYNPSNENKHGTRCAGEVAALRNDKCSVGVAYNAKIGGVRMLDGDVTDITEADSLALNPQHIDIYSSSWGPNDDGHTIEGPGPLAQKSFVNGITQGRGGKGSIFVWAAGNGGSAHDNCNCDGYAASPYTIAISSLTEAGKHPWYAEKCTANLAATFSSGGSGEKKIISTDLHHRCTDQHTGTSASAPMAAGLIALALEENNSLTWRDVQYIIVYSSNSNIPRDGDAITNGAGLKVGNKYGFGVMDAAALINRARYWVNVPEQLSCNVSAELSETDVSHDSSLRVKVEIDKSNCPIGYLEHVQAIVNLSVLQGYRGNVRIDLQSPHDTLSTLLPYRMSDSRSQGRKEGIKDWPFLSVMSWGEDPKGTWTLTITVKANTKVHLSNYNLVLHGVAGKPEAVSNIPDRCSDQCKGGCSGAGPQHCDVCKGYRVSTSHKCVSTCPPGTFKDGHMCYPCIDHCLECSGDSTCDVCAPGILKLPSGGCGHSCPNSTYLDAQANKCKVCHLSCLQCDGPDDAHCTVCPSKQYILADGHCRLHTQCPQGKYFDTRVFECRACYYDCAECSGRESNDCSACHSGRTLVDGVCVYNKECANGEYYNDDTNGCAQCPPGCGLCDDEHTCTSCDAEHYLYESRVINTDQMRTSCVSKCPKGYYGEQRGCLPCPPFCATCVTPGACTSCTREGAEVIKGACPQPCKPMEYFDSGTASCVNCPPTCQNCISNTVCTSCPEGTYLGLSGQCYSSCPNHTVANSDTGRCESVQCHDSCLTCSGIESDQCLSCQEPRKLFENTCIDGCASGEYFTGTECKSCDRSCATCSGPTDADCEMCPKGRFQDHGHCLESCRPGSYGNRGECISCPMGCMKCEDGVCSKCGKGFILNDKHCTAVSPQRTPESISPIDVSSNNNGAPSIVLLIVTLCLLIAALIIVVVGVAFWKRDQLYRRLIVRPRKYQMLYTPNSTQLDINGLDDFDTSDSETDVFTKLGK